MKIDPKVELIYILHAFQIGIGCVLFEYVWNDYALEWSIYRVLSYAAGAFVFLHSMNIVDTSDVRKETLTFFMTALVYMAIAPFVAYVMGVFPAELTPRMFLLYPLQVNAMNAGLYLVSMLISSELFDYTDNKEDECCHSAK